MDGNVRCYDRAGLYSVEEKRGEVEEGLGRGERLLYILGPITCIVVYIMVLYNT